MSLLMRVVTKDYYHYYMNGVKIFSLNKHKWYNRKYASDEYVENGYIHLTITNSRLWYEEKRKTRRVKYRLKKSIIEQLNKLDNG